MPTLKFDFDRAPFFSPKRKAEQEVPSAKQSLITINTHALDSPNKRKDQMDLIYISPLDPSKYHHTVFNLLYIMSVP